VTPQDIQETLPAWLAIMVVCIAVLLLLMTGSVLIPIKAVITNVLSLGASFGIITLVFQMGGLDK
jgi:putative drug exporter of the RND superfamily